MHYSPKRTFLLTFLFSLTLAQSQTPPSATISTPSTTSEPTSASSQDLALSSLSSRMVSFSASLASARSSSLSVGGAAGAACTGKSIRPCMGLCGADVVCRCQVYGGGRWGCCFGIECFGMRGGGMYGMDQGASTRSMRSSIRRQTRGSSLCVVAGSDFSIRASMLNSCHSSSSLFPPPSQDHLE